MERHCKCGVGIYLCYLSFVYVRASVDWSIFGCDKLRFSYIHNRRRTSSSVWKTDLSTRRNRTRMRRVVHPPVRVDRGRQRDTNKNKHKNIQVNDSIWNKINNFFAISNFIYASRLWTFCCSLWTSKSKNFTKNLPWRKYTREKKHVARKCEVF